MHIGLLEIKNAEAHIQKPNSKVIFECFFFLIIISLEYVILKVWILIQLHKLNTNFYAI